MIDDSPLSLGCQGDLFIIREHRHGALVSYSESSCSFRIQHGLFVIVFIHHVQDIPLNMVTRSHSGSRSLEVFGLVSSSGSLAYPLRDLLQIDTLNVLPCICVVVISPRACLSEEPFLFYFLARSGVREQNTQDWS